MQMKLIFTYFLLIGIAFSQENAFTIPLKFGRFDENCLYLTTNKVFACHEFSQLMEINLDSPSQYLFIKNKTFTHGLTAIDGFNSIIYAGFSNGQLTAYNTKTKKVLFSHQDANYSIKAIKVFQHGTYLVITDNGKILYYQNQTLKDQLDIKTNFLYLTKNNLENGFVGVTQNWQGSIHVHQIKIKKNKVVVEKKTIKIKAPPKTLYAFNNGKLYSLVNKKLSIIDLKIGKIIKEEEFLFLNVPVNFGKKGDEFFISEADGKLLFLDEISLNLKRTEIFEQQIQTLLTFNQQLFVFGFVNLIVK